MSSVLRIKGISKDMILNYKKEKVTPCEVWRNVIYYVNMPSKAIQKKDLFETKTYTCWYCDMEYTGREIFFPRSEEPAHYMSEGQFNSFPCVVSYALLHIKKVDYADSYQKILNLYKVFYPNKDIKYIRPAPSKYLRQRYGGEYTDEEYAFLLTVD